MVKVRRAKPKEKKEAKPKRKKDTFIYQFGCLISRGF